MHHEEEVIETKDKTLKSQKWEWMSLMKIKTHTNEIQKMGCMIKNGCDKNWNTQK